LDTHKVGTGDRRPKGQWGGETHSILINILEHGAKKGGVLEKGHTGVPVLQL